MSPSRSRKIYDSEINVRIRWFWHCGIEIRLGDDMNGYVALLLDGNNGIKDYLTSGGRIEVAQRMAGPSIAKANLTHQFPSTAMRFARILKAA